MLENVEKERGIVINTATESVQDEAIVEAAELAIEANETDPAEEKTMGIVAEIMDLFRERLGSGEILPYDLAEGLAVTLAGTIYAIVPPDKQNVVQREAESLARKTLKTFDQQVTKKDIRFVSQLLGAAKVSSYVMSYGNKVLTQHRLEAQQHAKKVTEQFEAQVK